MAEQFEALIKAKLDTSDFESQISSLQPKNKVKIQVDTKDIQNQVETALQGINVSGLNAKLNKAVSDIKLDGIDMGKFITKHFGITDKKTINAVQKQFNSMVDSVADSYTGKGIGDTSKMQKAIFDTIMKNGTVKKTIVGNVDQAMLDYFKGTSFYVNDESYKKLGGKVGFEELLKKYPGRLTRDKSKGHDIENEWIQALGQFGAAMETDYSFNLNNKEDQLRQMLATIRAAGGSSRNVSIPFEHLTGSERQSIEQEIDKYAFEASRHVRSSFDSIMNETASGNQPIDIKIDANQIVSEIQSALSSADFKVNLNLSDIADQISTGVEAGINRTANNIKNSANTVGRNLVEGEILPPEAKAAAESIMSKEIYGTFKVSKAASDNYQSQMESVVKELTKGKGQLVSASIKTKTGDVKQVTDGNEFIVGNIEELSSAQIKYNNELGQTITKTLEWKKIGSEIVKDKNDNDVVKDIFGWRESKSSYDISGDVVSSLSNQEVAAGKLNITLQETKRRIEDLTQTNPIKDPAHLDALREQANKTSTAIDNLAHSDKSMFSENELDAKANLKLLQTMESEYRRAENGGMSLRSKDFDTNKGLQQERLNQFKAEIERSNVDASTMTKTLADLQTQLDDTFDIGSLSKFANALDVEKAKLKTVSEDIKSSTSNEKLGVNKSSLESQINNFSNIDPRIATLTSSINGADVSVESLLNDLSKVNSAAELSTVKTKFEAFKNTVKEAGIEVQDTANQLQKIQDKINLGDMDSKISKLENRQGKWQGYNESVAQKLFGDQGINTSAYQQSIDKIRDLRTEINALNAKMSSDTATDADKAALISKYDQLENEMRQCGNQANILDDQMRQLGNAESAISKGNKLDAYMSKNTRAMKTYGNQLKDLRKQYEELEKTGGSTVAVDKQVQSLQAKIKSEGLEGGGFFDRLKNAGKSLLNYATISGALYQASNAVKQMASNVLEVDSAMTSLYKVTDETSQAYDKFLNNAGKNSKDLGRTMSSYIEQTAEWSKLGYNLQQSTELSKVSSMYANTGEVDDATAVSDLVTALKAYNLEATEAINVGDRLNALGNNFATSSADLGEGLSKAASSLATANTDIDKSLAMITGMAEITQHADESANALKILSMRVRGYDEETEGYTNDVEELNGKIANLTKTAKTPGGISLFTDESKQTYKDIYTLMEQISEIYDSLSDKQSAELLEALAGKNRGNQIAALISGFQSGQIQKAYKTSLNSDGSMQQEQDRWMESLEARIAQFQSTWQQLSVDTLNSDWLKGIVDVGTGFLDVLDNIINNFGTIDTLISTVLSGATIKSFA